MKKLLTRNLGLKLASLVRAFVLWFLVAQIYDPKDTVTFNNIQVRLINTDLLEQEGKVYEVLDNSNLVRVTVTGPQSIVKSELRRNDIVAEADMSKLTDINTIAITYYCENISNDSVEIRGNHDSVRLNVEDKASKWIKLESTTLGEVASGYMIGNVTLDQTNIEVTGPKSAISQIDHAGVDINVADSTSSLSANVDIKLYDADDNELSLETVKKNVDSAHMTVEVLATKEVPVEIEYMGVPEDGYMATGEVESSRSTVKIAGTASALLGVSAITVPEDRMNITGQSSDLVDIINLKEYLPANVRLADKSFDGKITATVYIEPIATKDLSVPAENITISGVPEGMDVQLLQQRFHFGGEVHIAVARAGLGLLNEDFLVRHLDRVAADVDGTLLPINVAPLQTAALTPPHSCGDDELEVGFIQNAHGFQRLNQFFHRFIIRNLFLFLLSCVFVGAPRGIVIEIAALHRVGEDAAQAAVDTLDRRFRERLSCRFIFLLPQLCVQTAEVFRPQIDELVAAEVRLEAFNILLLAHECRLRQFIWRNGLQPDLGVFFERD